MLKVIMDYAARGEQIPNQEQLARELGLSPKSKGSVSTALANLQKEGFITADKTSTGKIRTRTIRLRKLLPARPVPVMGQVAAGQPLLSTGEDVKEFVLLPMQYIRSMEVYMLEVHGDSMTGDGILDGDYVIVASSQEMPTEHEIAVVRIEEETTIKRVRKEGNSITLISSNPDHEELKYDESHQPSIQGKVIGVIRWPT